MEQAQIENRMQSMELGQKFEAMSFDEFQRDILHCK